MAFLVCNKCDIYYEIHAKNEPEEIGKCECGNQLKFYHSLEEHYEEKGNEKINHDTDFDQLITAYESLIAKIILLCINELPFNVGKEKILEVLRGSRSMFILDNEFQNLPTYSVFADLKKDALESMINNLISLGYLNGKKNPKNPDWVILELSTSGKNFITSGNTIETQWVEKKIKKPIPPYDKELYSELRELRENLALERNIPLYTVCGNNILLELAHNMPSDPDSMIKISGIGKGFMTNYGEIFLKKIIEHKRSN